MSFKDIAAIAGSAMHAQTLRLNTVASNLANADVASATEEAAYRARKPVFAAVDIAGGRGALRGFQVRVLDVVESAEPVRGLYQPGNPLADSTGTVFYPNVNHVEEMTDMMSASRAFATNADVLARSYLMQQEVLKLGQQG